MEPSTFDAASSLLQLSSLVSEDQNTGQKDDETQVAEGLHDKYEVHTPPSTPKHADVKVSPTKTLHIHLKEVKRPRDDLLHLFYDADDGTRIVVPFEKGDTEFTLKKRRVQALLNLEQRKCSTSVVVFCFWTQSTFRINFDRNAWNVFRATPQQERYVFNNILQLVIIRVSCTCNDSCVKKCRNCCNPQWRSSCMTPILLHYVMPMPDYRYRLDECHKQFAEFKPIECTTCTTLWVRKLPQLVVRM